MQDFERLGVFYLGKQYDLTARKATDQLVLYDAKDLTTHAVCVGMTGSGKTGLCLALLEEAAIDNIPALVIDPKGDLTNLLLTFPSLAPADFEPWIDPNEAARQGLAPEALASQTAERWKAGLAAWGEDGERIQRLRDAVEMAIYTPGSNAGLPLSVLRSLDAPLPATRDDNEALCDAVNAATDGLLELVGIEADPLQSREHILIASLLHDVWREGRSLDIAALIHAIQSPPMEKVGVLDLESFFPAKERFELAMRLNNLLASPGFAAWREGEPLQVQRMLYTAAGKPRISILSIAHLSDAERMFFVTLLLNEVIGWMRSQPGTSSLRAVLYMDEVFGYFPPSKNPPSKTPMLTLLKQARAFGLGIVLATQNPVDLDYKGLANCGTWLLGRLQTERDKLRVLDGLEGASAAAGASFDRSELERILSGLGSRVFLMNNVHEDRPVVFESRWALSYLHGPLTREQIGRLMAPQKAELAVHREARGEMPSRGPSDGKCGAAGASRPLLPPEIVERFAARQANLPPGGRICYRPALLGQAKLHFTQAAGKIDCWQDLTLLAGLDGDLPDEPWAEAIELDDAADLETQPEAGASFAPLPAELSQAKRYAELARKLRDYVYRNRKLSLWKCAPFKETSQPGESEADFRIRLAQRAREERDAAVEALRQKYAPKIATLAERIRKAQIRVEKERSQASERTLSAALSIGASMLSALFSRKLASTGNITRATTSMRQASRIARERQDVNDAGEGVEALEQQRAALEEELRAQIDRIAADLAPDKLPLAPVLVQPKKSEIEVGAVTLVWQPWIATAAGEMQPAS